MIAGFLGGSRQAGTASGMPSIPKSERERQRQPERPAARAALTEIDNRRGSEQPRIVGEAAASEGCGRTGVASGSHHQQLLLTLDQLPDFLEGLVERTTGNMTVNAFDQVASTGTGLPAIRPEPALA